MTSARIAVIGDYKADYTAHPETNAAIEVAARRGGIDPSYEWIATDAIERDGVATLEGFDAFWIAPGAPYSSLDGALAGIRYAREGGRPLVGT
jgi:CTP synthase (UTP-ammonia lyase)